MELANLQATHDPVASGQELHELVTRLYPICRSITGDGVRQTLRVLQEIIPLEIHEIPTGTPAFDWTIPKEWNIRDAYIKNSKGQRVVDFQACNLHVVGYSAPIKTTVPLAQLKAHTFTLPDHPSWIPYRTSYYKEDWGFCMSHDQLLQLTDEDYEVSIDASLENGHLTYGEYFLKGRTDDEILISVHTCHPSLANDNLSGVAVAAFLAKCLGGLSLRYSYRFLFVPATIGPITWLSQNESRVSRIKHGLILACVGDPGNFTYKKSRRGNADIDRAVIQILKDSGVPHQITEFSPYGYDERQFCSPAFDLPVGCLMRTPHGQFPEYHTSADNPDFVQPQYLADSFARLMRVLQLVEQNKTYLNLNPKCEPQLGRRGLYSAIGGQTHGKAHELAILWVLSLSDGEHSLLDIAERSGMTFDLIQSAADALYKHELLREIQPPQ